MTFANPYLLFGLFAILVPILIHLFNFRRYKTIYFSNVKMLEEIQNKTKRASQVQQLVVLILRVLGIAALVFAFAQPFLKEKGGKTNSGNIVSIFVDNSFSMDADADNTSSLYEAVDAARNIVSDFDYDDDFVLTTQDFSGEESHILNKDQILELLDNITTSPNSRSLKEICAFQNNTAHNSNKGNALKFYISDFQKNAFDFSALRNDTSAHICLIPTSSTEKNNISVDTCWFLSPIIRLGNVVTLVAKIQNYGSDDAQKVPLKLYVNGKQKAVASIDVAAKSYAECRLTYKIDEDGTNLGRLMIEDSPIVFDDELFFSYNVSDNSIVSIVYNKEPNRFLAALYGKDSVFTTQAMEYRQINYTQFRESNLIVLNEVPSLSSGLSDELSKFVNAGGTLLLFPADDMDKTLNAFLKSMGCGQFGALTKGKVECGKINGESVYFRDALGSNSERVDMPSTLQHYEILGGTVSEEPIMTLADGSRMLTCWNVGAGKVIVSAVAMRDEFGNAHRHAMFFVPLHNIGILTGTVQKLYNVIGKDNMQKINNVTEHSDDALVMRSSKNDVEFIPEQRRIGNETAVYFHDQVRQSDWYGLFKGNQQIGSFSFNYPRNESDMNFYSEKELSDMSQQYGDKYRVVAANTKNIAQAATEQLNGKPLWPLFLVLSLLFFLVEILLLRFWNRPAINEEKAN